MNRGLVKADYYEDASADTGGDVDVDISDSSTALKP